MVRSPLTDGVAKCFTPYVIPGDPERPFGYVVRLANGLWEERNGYEQELTRRGRFCDAAGGLIHKYRISHYSRPEDHPEADRCLLCHAPNPNHPDYDPTQDYIQCQIIRQHTMDALPNPYYYRMRNLMDDLVTADLQALLAAFGMDYND